jgi:hypothetical protein
MSVPNLKVLKWFTLLGIIFVSINYVPLLIPDKVYPVVFKKIILHVDKNTDPQKHRYYKYFRDFSEFYKNKNPIFILGRALKRIIVSPDKFHISMKTSDYKRLNEVVNRARKRGHIEDVDKDVKVNARIDFGNKVYGAKMGIKGVYLDHLMGKMWSFRIRLKENKTILGVNRFSIHNPHTRGGMREWLFQEALKFVGCMALRYNFVDVSINGNKIGIYAFEEFFDKRLVEHNRRREGPIVKLYITSNEKESILELSPKSQIKNPAYKRLYRLMMKKYQKFLNGDILTEDIFNIEKTAKYFAMTELFGAFHGNLRPNFVVYITPIDLKFEPIGFDNNACEWIEEFGMVFEERNVYGLKKQEIVRKIFYSKKFLKSYFNFLYEFTEEEFLNSFFNKIEASYIRVSGFMNSYPKERRIYRNAHYIRDLLFGTLGTYPYNDDKVESFYDKFISQLKAKEKSSVIQREAVSSRSIIPLKSLAELP